MTLKKINSFPQHVDNNNDEIPKLISEETVLVCVYKIGHCLMDIKLDK